MDGLRLPPALAQQMVEHARRDAPDECCGIMAGKDSLVLIVYPTTNVDHSPVKYTIDPQQMLQAMREADKAGMDVLGFYHSHTHTEAYPSPTDVWLAPPSDFFDYQYVIVSLREPEAPVIRCFRIAGREVNELPIEVAG